VKLKTSNGLFNGRFDDPQTGKAMKFSGAILQNQNSGAGYFLNGNDESGSVRIEPQN
jgi:hypothetical protein